MDILVEARMVQIVADEMKRLLPGQEFAIIIFSDDGHHRYIAAQKPGNDNAKMITRLQELIKDIETNHVQP